jgi:hypothetical protein
MAMKMKKRIFAIPAAPEATPVKPNTPASNEITAKIMAHLSIENLLLSCDGSS